MQKQKDSDNRIESRIYKIDKELFDSKDTDLIINKLITNYNSGLSKKDKIKSYKKLGNIKRDNCSIQIYYSAYASDHLLKGYLRSEFEEDKLSDFKNHSVNAIFFMVIEENLYAVCFGSGYFIIDDVVDTDFAIDFAKRVINPSVTKLEERTVIGDLFSINQLYRREHSLSASYSFGRIISELKASIREEIINSPDFAVIVSKKQVVNCDIGTNINLKKRLSLNELIKLVFFIDKLLCIDLTDEQKKLFGYYNTVKKIKGSDKTQTLNLKFAEYLLKQHDDKKSLDLDFCHYKEYNDFFCASNYKLSQNGTILYDWDGSCDAESILNSLYTKIDETDLVSEIYRKINVLSYDNDGELLTEGKLIDHLHGEVELDGKKYFRIDRKWYELRNDFFVTLEKQFRECMASNSIELRLDRWVSGEEGTYNASFSEKENIIVGDKLCPNGIELFDLLEIEETSNGKKKLYLYHNKNELAAATRDVCSQIRNAAKALTSVKNNSDNGILDEFWRLATTYDEATDSRIKLKNKMNTMGKQAFIELFSTGDVIFVLGYKHGGNIDNIKSNIAKFEIVDLIKTIKNEFNFEIKIMNLF